MYRETGPRSQAEQPAPRERRRQARRDWPWSQLEPAGAGAWSSRGANDVTGELFVRPGRRDGNVNRDKVCPCAHKTGLAACRAGGWQPCPSMFPRETRLISAQFRPNLCVIEVWRTRSVFYFKFSTCVLRVGFLGQSCAHLHVFIPKFRLNITIRLRFNKKIFFNFFSFQRSLSGA